jgi:MinD superfamily P-loop ATPase
MPTPVIRQVLERASDSGVVLLDCSPGTSCAVVTAVRAADVCLLVTEPTPLGLHDLALAVELCRTVGKPAAVILNRCDIGDDAVEKYCEQEGVPILLKIPFSRELAQSYAAGQPITRAIPEITKQLQDVVQNLTALADTQDQPMGGRNA